MYRDGPGGPQRHEGRSTPHSDTCFFWRPHGIGLHMETTTTRVLADHDGTNDDAGPGGPRRHEERSSSHNGTGFSWKPYGIGFFLETTTFGFCSVWKAMLWNFCSVWKVLLVVLGFFLLCQEVNSVIHWCRTFGIFVLSGRCVVMSLAVLVFLVSCAADREAP